MPRKKQTETKEKKKPGRKKHRTLAQIAAEVHLIPAKPGDVLNPEGINNAVPLTEQERHARTLARREIAELYPRLKNMTVEDFMTLDPRKLPVVEGIFVKSLQSDLITGSTEEIHRMYDRLLGRAHITATIETHDISDSSFEVDILSNDGMEELSIGDDETHNW